jgi:hypothetical protein
MMRWISGWMTTLGFFEKISASKTREYFFVAVNESPRLEVVVLACLVLMCVQVC